MNQLLSWFTATYHGSNRVSFWLRRSIEKLPFKQFLGVQLVGLAFVAAVVVPQASDMEDSHENRDGRAAANERKKESPWVKD